MTVRMKRYLTALLAAAVLAVCLPSAAGAAEAESAVRETEAPSGQWQVDLNGSVQGEAVLKVIVYCGGSPLAGVQVTVNGRQTEETGQDGAAVFRGLRPGRIYPLVCLKQGYTYTGPGTITMTDGGETTVGVSMTKNSSGGESSGGGSGGGNSGSVIPMPAPEPTPVPRPDPTPAPAPEEPPAPLTSPSGQPEPSVTPAIPEQPGGQPEGTGPVAPTARPGSAVPADADESGAGNEAGGSADAPILVEPPAGAAAVQVPPEQIQASVDAEAPVEVSYIDEAGIKQAVTLPAFDPHDQALLGDSELWLEHLDQDKPILHVIADREENSPSSVAVPHNIVAASRERGLDVRVTIRAGDGEVMLDERLRMELFASPTFDAQDFKVEFEPVNGQKWLVFTNEFHTHPEDALYVPATALQVAGEDGWGIRLRIYSPEEKTDLWYEWIFNPGDLRGVAESLTDADLFISPEMPAGDEVIAKLDTEQYLAEYITISYSGMLPAPAWLRVKNMAGFVPGTPITLLYSNQETGELEIVYDKLEVGQDGFITFGMDHCSNYVLTAPKAAPGQTISPESPGDSPKAGADWRRAASIAGGILGAGLLLLVFFLLRRRDGDPDLALPMLKALAGARDVPLSARELFANTRDRDRAMGSCGRSSSRAMRDTLRMLRRQGAVRAAQTGWRMTETGSELMEKLQREFDERRGTSAGME